MQVFDSLIHEHDLRLVLLAGCICLLACFTNLTLIVRAEAATSTTRQLWSLASAAVFGSGVWSLHFVAMLAFMPDMQIAYRVGPTIGSIAVAILGTAIANAAWGFDRTRPAAGVLLGLAVVAMHYTGMMGMSPPGTVQFDHALVAASVLIGVACSVTVQLRSCLISRLGRRIELTLWLTLCVCCVHFVGMSAVTITPDPAIVPTGLVIGSRQLAFVVGAMSLAILVASLAAALVDQHMDRRALEGLQRIRLLASLSQEGMVIHRGGIIVEANEAGGRVFGLPEQDLLGRALLDLFAPADRPAIGPMLVLGGAPVKSMEVMARAVSGTLVPVEIALSDIDYEGRPAAAMAIRDLSDRKRSEDQIRHLARHDALTDLPNRFRLKECLQLALAEAARTGSMLAVLYIDLDRFKQVNDLLGHATGDALLIQASRRLRAELRQDDLLARIGGDEFVVVAPVDRTPHIATGIAGRLVESLSQRFELNGHEAHIGASIGIALYPKDGIDQESLMRAADTALYRVKESGRNNFRLFEAGMDAHVQQRLQLEHDLRHAVDRHELELHYQPIVHCGTGKTEGYEALVRWHHPTRGLIPPLDFIPMAEATSQIGRIGEWVIRAACRAARCWAEPHWVAVNVSPVQFLQPDLDSRIGTILAEEGLPANRLEIEVTENVFISDRQQALDILTALRRRGVRVSLDDFGTGYSSLSYLRSFAFDKIKIDRSFTKALGIRAEGRQEDAATIVRTIIGLGHELGLTIVAEGIETAQQLAHMQDRGCDYVQGFLLGRPTAEPAAGSGWLGKARSGLCPEPRQGPGSLDPVYEGETGRGLHGPL